MILNLASASRRPTSVSEMACMKAKDRGPVSARRAGAGGRVRPEERTPGDQPDIHNDISIILVRHSGLDPESRVLMDSCSVSVMRQATSHQFSSDAPHASEIRNLLVRVCVRRVNFSVDDEAAHRVRGRVSAAIHQGLKTCSHIRGTSVEAMIVNASCPSLYARTSQGPAPHVDHPVTRR
jgi:hypothetical protein